MIRYHQASSVLMFAEDPLELSVDALEHRQQLRIEVLGRRSAVPFGDDRECLVVIERLLLGSHTS